MNDEREQQDYLSRAEDALHSGRKFLHYWGSESDRKNAAKHLRQAILNYLKSFAESNGFPGFPFDCDTNSILQMVSVLKAHSHFTRDCGIDDVDRKLVLIDGWGDLSPFDDQPAPSKQDLDAALAIAVGWIENP